MVFDFDCAIIGGGPGGLVAGIYLRRFQRRTILINGGIPRAAWIPKTHNLLGYERGISGPRLLERLQRQFRKLGPETLSAHARLRPLERGGFELETGGGSLRARKVILATGIEDHQPNLDNVADLRLRGLLRYCPICDAYEYRGKKITVFARDEHGFKSTMFLSAYTSRLRVVIEPGCELSRSWAGKLERAGVDVKRGRLAAVEPARMHKASWIHLEGQRPFISEVNYIMLGATVNDSAFAHLTGLRRTAEGYLLADRDQKLSKRDLFGVGDCVSHLAQISVAAGHAATAATKIHNELREESPSPRRRMLRPGYSRGKVVSKTSHGRTTQTHTSLLA
ncbi:MAG TPA: NAD(P)/FAD-dependent oxidoreductase [Bdellovibrionales bacterium]|nr:NAD(P)/FAD-dependent oxidoreductase [Bdellovibrionales bacterium]